MSKTKMRCITCGKWFQSANAKEVTCPDCTQKARKEKMATKNAPPTAGKPIGATDQGRRPAVPPPPKPKSTQSGTAHWLDTLQDVKVAEPDQPPPRPKQSAPPASRDDRSGPGGFRPPAGPTAYREGSYREDRERSTGESGSRGPGGYREERGPGGYRVGGGSGLPSSTVGPRPRQPMEGGFGRGPRPDKPYPTGPREGGNQKPRGKGKPGPRKPPAPPKPKREKIPPPEPFTPTPEQVTQVEERYLELSTPIEFDGIRTRIAHELGIPKKAVKKIVKELRDRQDIPSWWELQTYKGDPEEMERIKNIYLPLLPVPPVGVHKQIADQLDIKAGVIYQAIKAIRLEMNLPQYNDPTLHGPDFVLHPKKKRGQAEQPAEESSAIQTEQPAEGVAAAPTEPPVGEASATQAEQPAEGVAAAPTEPPVEEASTTQVEQPAEEAVATQAEATSEAVEATTPIPENTDAVPVTESAASVEE
jgi:hypothetical protein